MKTTEKMVPELRFKEFEGAWKESKLSDYIEFISGYAFKSNEMKSDRSNFQIIKMSNVYKSKLQLDRSPSYWEKISKKEKKSLLREKDIILTLTGTVGKKDYGYSVVIPENNKFLLNQRLVCLRFKEKISDGDFINNLIKTSRFYYSFFNESKGGTGNQSNVGVEDLRNIKLNIPSLPEQEKIASFLSAVDEKISQLSRKKELLGQYKKGMMQKLFPPAGGQVPEIRFKDDNGNDFPHWEEKKLGNISKIITGSTPPTNERKFYDGDKLFVSPADVSENRIVNNTKAKLTEEGLNKGRKINKGSVLFVCIGSTIGKVAQAGKECITNQQINAVEGLDDYENDFIYYLLLLNGKKIKLLAGVQAVPQINKTEFSKLKFKYPSIREQQKIANYLSALDAKIAGVEQQISQAQRFKKGLLQKMFV